MSNFFEKMKDKSKEIFLINFLIFVPMWIIFFVNYYIFNNSLNNFGVHPRDLSFIGILEIFTFWLLHANYSHIVGNTAVMLPLLFMIIFLEKNPIKPVLILISLSGLFTWLLGLPNSVHIGASGLLFALFGYILASLLIGRNFFYLIPVILVGYFYSQSIVHGLIPTEGISLAAHMGGFIAGLITGSIIHKKENDNSYLYKKTFKEKLNSLVWDIKYKLKKK